MLEAAHYGFLEWDVMETGTEDISLAERLPTLYWLLARRDGGKVIVQWVDSIGKRFVGRPNSAVKRKRRVIRG